MSTEATVSAEASGTPPEPDVARPTSTELLADNEQLPPRQPAGQTPSQTVGPFFGYALPYTGGPQLVPAVRPDAIRLHGTVFDGAGAPIPDALLELWQPDASGALVRRAGSRRRERGDFTGFGRAAVDVEGNYEFVTILPGPIGGSAAHWALLTVFARGLLHHLFTRAYFVERDGAVPSDALLQRLPADRRDTLLAREHQHGRYRFDIHLQGDSETVFLDYPGVGASDGR
ncbi:protocatechuate 3,4-dioxygenase subunit alpha [uncultured Amnibacterium sp.]|uniref:protocatechuate 3,4-dioxygenase subunit alpha n=1 Tax=uncultured Amnibacterium sp. TaxID=1631851 RepID=UPI0035C9E67A